MIIHISSYTGGKDYTTGPYNVTFAAGQTHAPVIVNINKDNEVDDSEYFNLAIKQTRLLSSNRVCITTGILSQTRVIIMDNNTSEKQ